MGPWAGTLTLGRKCSAAPQGELNRAFLQRHSLPSPPSPLPSSPPRSKHSPWVGAERTRRETAWGAAGGEERNSGTFKNSASKTPSSSWARSKKSLLMMDLRPTWMGGQARLTAPRGAGPGLLSDPPFHPHLGESEDLCRPAVPRAGATGLVVPEVMPRGPIW